MTRAALISLHTSPLVQPGSGDSGGMNVYVREVAASLAQAGVECTTYTRADRPGLRSEVLVEPGHRVVHVPAGPYDLPKEALPDVVDEFAARVRDHVVAHGGVDVIHGNYWLSGVAGHRLKHDLDVPLVSTFHTLARVKAEGGDLEPEWRDQAEADIIACSDAICVSCPEEERQFRRLYGDPRGVIEIVPPAVEHAFFAPGDRRGARQAIDLPIDRPVVLFVGRIQPLKAPDMAISALAVMRHDDAVLVLVGGASGADGAAEAAAARRLVADLGLDQRVRFVEPKPHHLLSSYYRAADVVVVPSRSESFGLVALEAAACGVPVVASAVGGLLNVVHDEVTGLLVAGRDPVRYAAAIDRLLDAPAFAATLGHMAAANARGFTWSLTAARLRRLYGDLVEQRLPLRDVLHLTTTTVSPVSDLFDAPALAGFERQIDAWLSGFAAASPVVRAVDRADGDEVRWYVRMAGEAKDFITVWLTLGQRTLRYETYVLPAPEENAAALYEHLLRRNERLVGAHFSIGVEDAVFLRGELPLAALDEDELDRAVGTLYATVEQCFAPMLRIAFASRFA